MLVKTIESDGLAHFSYFLSDEEEAVVVDPRRDCAIYSQLAEKACVKIKYILETHRNEDYAIGSIELQNVTNAEIAHSKETPFTYGEHNLTDNETITIGSIRIKTLYTPGHTNDSMCYVIYEAANSADPLSVFTGDTLFVGNVGRTDLPGLDIWREQSEKLFNSLHEKVLPLGDHVLIYPGHGAGSVCGSGISDRRISTIGYERRSKPLLHVDKKAFVDQMMKQRLLRPPYFRKMEQYNLNGPPLLKEAGLPQPLGVNEFEREMQKNGTVIVDTRMPSAFAGSHIPGSLNIWLDGLSLYPGWVLTYDQRILLVLERKEDLETAKAYLYRLGFDTIRGYLCPGIGKWRNMGKPTERLDTLSPTLLKKRLPQVVLVDVREREEWEEGHIEGSKHIYVGHIQAQANRLPRDRIIATTCAVGSRGGLAASILRKMGFKEVYNVIGGMNAWENLGYPTSK